MANGKFEIRWARDLRKQATQQMRAAAVRGVSDTAEVLLQEANKTAPHAKGPLRGSGVASVDPQKVAAAVSYDTPYALRQHEDTRLRHPDPQNPGSDPRGRAKWLQKTLQENAPRYKRHIEQTIRRATGG